MTHGFAGFLSSIRCQSSLYLLFISLVQFCYAQTVVLASNLASIQYNPPTSERATWNVFNEGSFVGFSTKSGDATASFSFVGNSITLHADPEKFTTNVNITLDGFSYTADALSGPGTDSVAFTKSGLEADVNHTIAIQRSSDFTANNQGNIWNILYITFTPPSGASSTVPPSAPSPISAAAPFSSPAFAMTPAQSSAAPHHSSTPGIIAGAVVGALLGASLMCLFAFLLVRRRRRNRSLKLTPEPLVLGTIPTRPRRSRSHFRQIYSDRLPHFAAPSSIWPSSALTPPTRDGPSLFPPVRNSRHEKITPFAMPTKDTKAMNQPPPPKHQMLQHTSFFVANPSSRSGRTSPSVGNGNADVGSGDVSLPVQTATMSTPVNTSKVFKGKREEQKRTYREKAKDRSAHEGLRLEKAEARDEHVRKRREKEKGKQRAIEIEPVTPPRMTRAQSLRRFFFTTNPNPSTSSGSSTVSSNRSARSRAAAAAVAIYNRTPQRQKEPSLAPLLSVPETVIMKDSTRTQSKDSPVPKRNRQSHTKRQSQTVFFTTNPSPPDVTDHGHEDVGTDSLVSAEPIPWAAKGKERAID
ncbi:hypothetical protein DFH11DRAFT_375865 [Phellopilus nigrolimitatus]|nr:hypothetical protein DFH11DRAFT_375865 [Phellopilus nigrolimitatus]